jgi:hypothetical protein
MWLADIRWLLLMLLTGSVAWNMWASMHFTSLPAAPLHVKVVRRMHSSSESTSEGLRSRDELRVERLEVINLRLNKFVTSREGSPFQENQSPAGQQQAVLKDKEDLSSQHLLSDGNHEQSQSKFLALRGSEHVSSPAVDLSGATESSQGRDSAISGKPESEAAGSNAHQNARPATTPREVPGGEPGAGLEQQRAAELALLPPQGQSCEGWLREADARAGGRDFHSMPVTVWDNGPADIDQCDVPCRIEAGYIWPGASYDAGVWIDRNIRNRPSPVLINMESVSNYPDLDVDKAHADGYKIVMTPRLDSDVPATYLSWSGAGGFLPPVFQKGFAS